jgi:hypothetical protein
VGGENPWFAKMDNLKKKHKTRSLTLFYTDFTFHYVLIFLDVATSMTKLVGRLVTQSLAKLMVGYLGDIDKNTWDSTSQSGDFTASSCLGITRW